MAKELPYFRFTVSEWQNGDITLEDYEVQGFFINFCAFYWIRDCILTKEQAFKKFSNARVLLELCLERGIIKENLLENLLEVKFLDEQRELLKGRSEKRAKAGKLGGLAKSSNARVLLQQKSSYKDKDKDKDKDVPKQVIQLLNQKTGAQYKTTTKETISLITARLKEGFTFEDFEKVIETKVEDWENDDKYRKFLRPKTLFRASNFEGYLNQKLKPKPSPKAKTENTLLMEALTL